jgi:uncharacterized protein YggE
MPTPHTYSQGITNLDSVSFVASDEALAKAQQEALKKAVENAQTQADAVLDAIGAKEQGIVAVQVGNASPRMLPRISDNRFAVDTGASLYPRVITAGAHVTNPCPCLAARPLPMAAPPMMDEMAASKGVPPPIEAGTQTVEAAVTLSIKYN